MKKEYPYIAKGRNGSTVCFYKEGECIIIKESNKLFTADIYPLGKKIDNIWAEESDVLYTPIGITIRSSVGEAKREYPHIAIGNIFKTVVLYYAPGEGFCLETGENSYFQPGTAVIGQDNDTFSRVCGIIVTSTQE